MWSLAGVLILLVGGLTLTRSDPLPTSNQIPVDWGKYIKFLISSNLCNAADYLGKFALLL